jgi:hypothetical protein
MMRAILYVCLAFVLAAATAHAAPADKDKDETQRSLGIFGAWKTYEAHEKGQPVCYMALMGTGAPLVKTDTAKKKGAKAKSKTVPRSAPVLTIAHRPTEGETDVVSYNAGYMFKAGSETHIQINKTTYSLFTAKDTAWTRDAAGDHALAAAIRNGKAASATSQPATTGVGEITDSFDLKGADQAYKVISRTCGLMGPEAPPKAPAKKKSKTAPVAP